MSTPLNFVAVGGTFVHDFPRDNLQHAIDQGKLWVTDILAFQHGEDTKIFEDVFFREADGIASIYGIDREDALPLGLIDEAATRQQQFIRFVRSESMNRCANLGAILNTFRGAEYSYIGKVTAAYICSRKEKLDMGIGYISNTGKFELLVVDLSNNSWLDDARSARSLCKLD